MKTIPMPRPAVIRAAICVAALMFQGASASFAQAVPVTSVLLYPSGATLERSARVAPGASTLRIPGLPANFDPQTIRVEADGGIHIGEVSTQDAGGTEAAGRRQAELEAKILDLQDRKAVLEVESKSAELVRDYLQRMLTMPPAGERAPGAPQDPKALAGVLEVVSHEGKEALARMQRVAVQKRELDRQIQALQSDLARVRGGARDMRTISVNLAADRPGVVHVSYHLNGAGWRPAYRAELDSQSSRVVLERQATLSQTTGEDWNGVRLKLSTGQPRLSPQGPDPRTWRVAQRPIVPLNAVEGRMRSEAVAQRAVPAPAAAPAAAMADMLKSVDEAFAVTEFQNTFSTEFEVPGTVTLASDGTQITVLLASQVLAAKQRVRVVPRADTAAYVTAEADRPEGVWPAGPMQLYRDGSRVGSMPWNPQPAERFAFSFGRDELVRVKLDRTRERSGEGGLLSRRAEREVSDEFTVESRHKSPVDLLLLEATPVSSADDIQVKAAFEPAPTLRDWEKHSGVVGWERALAPGQSLNFRVNYLISHPKEMAVIGLP